MEEISCKICSWLEEEESGYWCPILHKHIARLNVGHIQIGCTPEVRNVGIEKWRIKARQKYPRLKSVFVALGYQYNEQIRHQQWKEKTTLANMTINRRQDGSNKSKRELTIELKELRDKALQRCHPDLNPVDDWQYYNEETAKINEAFARGKEIIERRFQ